MNAETAASADNGSSRLTLVTWLKIAATILVPMSMLLFSGTLDSKIVTFLVITFAAIMLLAFGFVDMGVIGLAVPMFILMFDIAPMDRVFYPWMTDLIWLILGAQILAVGLDRSGILKRVAYGSIRFCKGSFTKLMWILFGVLIIEAFITFANGYMINVALFWSLCKAFKYWKVKQSAILLFVMGMVGGMACVITFFPYYNAAISTGFQTVIPDFGWGWYEQLVLFWPGYILMILYIFILTKVYKTDKMPIIEGGIEYFINEYEKLGPFSRKEKFALVITAIIFLYVMLIPLTNWEMLYGFTILPLLFLMPGVNILDEVNFSDININMYLVISAFAGMGSVASYIGLNTIIADSIRPMLDGTGTIFAAIMITLLGVLANIIMTPGGIVTSLSGTVGAICLSTGLDTVIGAFALMYSLDLTFLPYQDMGTLQEFAPGYVSMGDFVQLAVIRFIVFFGGYLILIVPYWHFLGRI